MVSLSVTDYLNRVVVGRIVHIGGRKLKGWRGSWKCWRGSYTGIEGVEAGAGSVASYFRTLLFN